MRLDSTAADTSVINIPMLGINLSIPNPSKEEMVKPAAADRLASFIIRLSPVVVVVVLVVEGGLAANLAACCEPCVWRTFGNATWWTVGENPAVKGSNNRSTNKRRPIMVSRECQK